MERIHFLDKILSQGKKSEKEERFWKKRKILIVFTNQETNR